MATGKRKPAAGKPAPRKTSPKPAARRAAAADELRRQADELRRGAEERLDELSAATSPSTDDLAAAVHELRVHQIELEMQNEELRRAQLELEVQRAKYFEFFDLAPVGYLTVGDQGIVSDANLTAAHLLDVERQLLVGQPFSAFVFAPDRDAYYLLQRRHEKTGEPQTCELRFARASGEPIWASLQWKPRPRGEGEPLSYHLTFSDVSARKQAEQRLQYIMKAVESASDAIGISDAQGHHIFQNEASSALFGYETAEEMEAAGGGPAVVKDPGTAREMFETIESGKPWAGELDMVTKSGRVFPAHERADAIIDPDGRIIGLIGIVTDITERKQAEKALRESEARYRSLFEDSPIAMWEDDHSAVKLHLEELLAGGVDDVIAFALADPQEYARCVDLIRVVDANKAAVRLFEAESREDLLARNSDIYRDESEPGIWRLWQAMLAGERSVTFEEADHTLTGKDIEVLETCTVVPGHEQTFDRVYLADVDISEQQRAAAELEASAAQVRQALAATVAALSATTELRDPYTAGHQRRVAELAGAIAAGLGWDAARIEMVTTAGLLHDVGKIVVPAEILARPGRLSELEMDIIRRHAAASAALIAGIEFGGPVAAIVNQHHERLDGSGYPQGLRGENILPEARILAVADVVEAMSSHRPYRPALGMEVALAEVREYAGEKYDAEVVTVCGRLVEEQGFQFTP